MSVKAVKRKAVSAISVLRSFGRVVCVNRKLTLCTQDVQTENIQSSAFFRCRAFLMYANGGKYGQATTESFFIQKAIGL